MTMPTYDSRPKTENRMARVLPASVVAKFGEVAEALSYIGGSVLDAGVWVAQRPGAFVASLQKLHETTPPWHNIGDANPSSQSRDTTSLE